MRPRLRIAGALALVITLGVVCGWTFLNADVSQTTAVNLNGATVLYPVTGNTQIPVGMIYPGLGTFSVINQGTTNERIELQADNSNGQLRVVWRNIQWSLTNPGQGKKRVFLNWWSSYQTAVELTTIADGKTAVTHVDRKLNGDPSAMSVVQNIADGIKTYAFTGMQVVYGTSVTCVPGTCPGAATAPVQSSMPVLSVIIPSVDAAAAATLQPVNFNATVKYMTYQYGDNLYTFNWPQSSVVLRHPTSTGIRTTRWSNFTTTPNGDLSLVPIVSNYFGRPVSIKEVFATPTGSTATGTINFPASNGVTVRLSDADLQAVYNSTESAYQLLKAAIAKVKSVGATILDLEGNTYDISLPEGNTTDPLVDLSNTKDLLVEGHGAHFVFHGMKKGLFLANALRVQVRNLSIDWADPLAFKGVMRQTTGQNAWTYLVLDDPQLAALPASKFPPPISVIVQFDQAEKNWKPQLNDERVVDLSFVQTEKNATTPPQYSGAIIDGKPTYHLAKRFPWVPDGTPVVATSRTIGTMAVDITLGSSDITMDHVTVTSSPAIAFLVANAGRGIRFTDCSVVRSDDPNRLISTLADGIHVLAGGDVFLENNVIANQGDDGINIKGKFWKITWISSDRTQMQTDAQPVIQKGDTLMVYRGSSLDTIGVYGVSDKINANSCAAANGKQCLKLSTALPSGITTSDLIVNPAYTSQRFIIRNNQLLNNRARGIVVQTGPGLIEGNTFTGQTTGGIWLVNEAVYWFEGPGAHDVTVRNNVFTSISKSVEGLLRSMLSRTPVGTTPQAPIVITSRIALTGNPGIGTAAARVLHDLLIEGNTINETPGLGMFVSSGKNIKVRQNFFQNTNTKSFVSGADVSGTVYVTHVSDVEFDNNTVSNGIVIGPDKDNVTINGVTQGAANKLKR